MLRGDIINEAGKLFKEIVRLEPPKFRVVFKDISLEDLQNVEFMKALFEIMKKAGLSKKELGRLFETGEAAPEQSSFPEM